MADRWETYRQKASQTVNKVIDVTQRFTKIGRIRVDILSLKREIDHQHTLLGRHVYDKVKAGESDKLPGDEQVQSYVQKIDELKARVAEKEAEIEALRARKEEAMTPEEAEEKAEPAVTEEPQPAAAEETEEAKEPKEEAKPEAEERAEEAGEKPKGTSRKKS